MLTIGNANTFLKYRIIRGEKTLPLWQVLVRAVLTRLTYCMSLVDHMGAVSENKSKKLNLKTS